MGQVIAICISEAKGTAKYEVESIEVIENYGFKGDAHAGNWHRQVSLLDFEKIEDFRAKGGNVEFGAFGENLVVKGMEVSKLKVGEKIEIGETLLEVTQIGKQCHAKCNIFYQVGECIMPKFGVFAKVLRGGIIKKQDNISKCNV